MTVSETVSFVQDLSESMDTEKKDNFTAYNSDALESNSSREARTDKQNALLEGVLARAAANTQLRIEDTVQDSRDNTSDEAASEKLRGTTKRDVEGKGEEDEEAAAAGVKLVESRAFRFLMPRNSQLQSFKTSSYRSKSFVLILECKKSLGYSTYPILNTNAFFSYVSWNASSYEDCAELCWRQHFCVSALFFGGSCTMSYRRGVCTDGRLSPSYSGPVLISCMNCF